MNISSKELKKITRNQLSGKYGTFIGINVLYILITLVASNLMDLVLGTSSVLNPLTATSATVETGLLCNAGSCTHSEWRIYPCSGEKRDEQK